MKIAFYVVREYLESKGYVLRMGWNPYRVFEKPGELPLLIEVEDKMVDNAQFEDIKNKIERRDRAD